MSCRVTIRAVAISTVGLALLVASPILGGEDAKGCRDHPLVSRYDGAYILHCEEQAYAAYPKVVGRRPGAGHEMPSETVEGRMTRIRYAAPEGRSTLEVFRNYQSALREAGFTLGFSCEQADCGHAFRVPELDGDGSRLHGRHHERYLTASLDRPEGRVSVALYVVLHRRILPALENRPVIALDIVEVQPMDTDRVEVDPDADGMASSIERHGRVALYGIYFEVGEATLEAESDATLTQIALLLEANPGLRLHVVGHTDSAGGFEHNLELSRRRSQAVVDALVERHGVSRDRLVPSGVGYLAPAASNRTASGRAKNRRVELVPD